MAATYAGPRKWKLGKKSLRTLDTDRLVNRTRAETTPRSPEDERNGVTVTRARDLAGRGVSESIALSF